MVTVCTVKCSAGIYKSLKVATAMYLTYLDFFLIITIIFVGKKNNIQTTHFNIFIIRG